jgi:hypothetical protein
LGLKFNKKIMKELIKWDIYEISTEKTPINWVKLRWRIRKLALENNQNVLTENTQDIELWVRFAVISWENSEFIKKYLQTIISDIKIKLVAEKLINPVLSKLKVNIENRYSL